MSGLKPILKLGVPVRDRPPTTASVRPVRGPGAALFLEAFRSLCRTKLPAHISPSTLAHARPGVSSTGPSPARARPHLRPPPRRRSVHTTRVAQATSSCTSTHHPPPLAGGAVGRRLRLHRLLPPVRGVAAAHLADAVRRFSGLVRASTARQTRLSTTPALPTPPPNPHPDPATSRQYWPMCTAPPRRNRIVAPCTPAAPSHPLLPGSSPPPSPPPYAPPPLHAAPPSPPICLTLRPCHWLASSTAPPATAATQPPPLWPTL